MNDDAKYLFDLMGYIVIEDALTPEEVARCNAAIDHRIDQLKSSPSYSGGSRALAGTSTRQDLGGMLSWERPWCEPFRELLVHPSISPYFNVILGKDYRLDHGPGLIAMNEGCEGGYATPWWRRTPKLLVGLFF